MTEEKTKKKKNTIINKKRFILFILATVIIIFVIIFAVINRKIKINADTNISKINADIHYKEILLEYNQDGKKEEFLKDYDKIQNAVAMYILNNSTLDQNSFGDIKKKIEKELNNGKWEILNIDMPTYWSGKWGINDDGVVKFKFSNKKIEPKWINDSDIINKVTLN